mgnify:CR=1 FL=1
MTNYETLLDLKKNFKDIITIHTVNQIVVGHEQATVRNVTSQGSIIPLSDFLMMTIVFFVFHRVGDHNVISLAQVRRQIMYHVTDMGYVIPVFLVLDNVTAMCGIVVHMIKIVIRMVLLK